jgi:hypothetical protein
VKKVKAEGEAASGAAWKKASSCGQKFKGGEHGTATDIHCHPLSSSVARCWRWIHHGSIQLFLLIVI